MTLRTLFAVSFGLFNLFICSSLPAEALGAAEQFKRTYLDPVLQDRGAYVQMAVHEAEAGQLAKIVIQSGRPDAEVGEYELILNPAASVATPPLLNLHRHTGADKYPVQIKATLEFPLHPNLDVARELRTLFIADPFLHPMQTLPNHSTQLAPPQQVLVDELKQIADEAHAAERATRVLLIAPPGLGKNLVVAKFLRDEIARSKEPYQIVFVVQSKEILDEALFTFPKELSIAKEQTRRNFAAAEKSGPPPLFVAASRSNLAARLDAVLARRQNGTRLFLVFDEVQHGGKIGGEFDQIFRQLDHSLRPGDALIGQSATPWHLDSDLMAVPFQNHLVTAFVTPREKKQLVEERRLIYLSRLMLFRAMAEGYLSPIHSYRQIRYLAGKDRPEILTRDYLRDEVTSLENLSEGERDVQLRRDVRVHEPLLQEMLREIRRVAHTDAGSGQIQTPNRGVIFVPSISHANLYARLLNEFAIGQPMEFRAYHSNQSDDSRREAMAWIRDEAKVNPTGVIQHKYLIAVRALGEGANVPNLNHLILARPYSQRDEVGMRDLLQHFGRGGRRAYGKPYFSVSDFTGDMRRLLFSAMDQQLVSKVFAPGGERDFAPFEVPVRPKERNIILDRDTLARGEFEANQIAIPSRLNIADAPTITLGSPGGEPPPPGGMTWEQFLNSKTSLRWLYAEARTLELNPGKDCGQSIFDLLRLSKAEILRCFPRSQKLVLRHLLLNYNLIEPSPGRQFRTDRSFGEYTSRVIQQNFSTPVPWTERELRAKEAPVDFSLKHALQQLPLENMGGSLTWDKNMSWEEVYSSPAFLFYFVYRAQPPQSVLLALIAGLQKQSLLTILPLLKNPEAWSKQFSRLKTYAEPIASALKDQGLFEVPDLKAPSPFTRRLLLDLPYLYVYGLTLTDTRPDRFHGFVNFDDYTKSIQAQLLTDPSPEKTQRGIRQTEYVLGAYLPPWFYWRLRIKKETFAESAACRLALSESSRPVNQSARKNATGR